MNIGDTNIKGTVKFYDTNKGFGFIRCDYQDHEEIFFHFSALQGLSLQTGDLVLFDVIQSKRRADQKNATNIKRRQ